MPLWMAGLRPSSPLGWTGLLVGSEVSVEPSEGSDVCSLRVSAVPDSLAAYEGAELLFDRTRDWLLSSVRYENGPEHRYVGATQDAGLTGPRSIELHYEGELEPAGVVAVTRFSVEPLDEEPRLDFPDGMLVVDDRGGEPVYRVARGGELTGTMSFEEFTTYGLTPARPPADGPGIDGRRPGRGWAFWAVNAALLAAAGGLFWLRRRVA